MMRVIHFRSNKAEGNLQLVKFTFFIILSKCHLGSSFENIEGASLLERERILFQVGQLDVGTCLIRGLPTTNLCRYKK